MAEENRTQLDSQLLNTESILCRIEEIRRSVLRNPPDDSPEPPSNSENLLQDWVRSLETQVEEFLSEHLDDVKEDGNLDVYLTCCKEELKSAEAESAKVHDEIEILKKTYVEGACQLEGDLESLKFALSNIKSQGDGEGKTGVFADGFGDAKDHRLPKEYLDQRFEVLDINYQIESNMRNLRTLQDLEVMLKRCETIERIEELFSGVKVISFEGNTIRLSLKTYICFDRLEPHLKSGNKFEPSELNHELIIELMSETMKLKHAEIFPNDVYLGDIFEATASFSEMNVASLHTSSSLWWFLQKVQQKIILCTLRKFMVKTANNSRYSIEYSDREELIIARVRGIDAFIKTFQGWPLSNSALKLVSLKPIDDDAEKLSLHLLCEIEEYANAVDVDTRKSITSFVGAIEEILSQRLRKEAHSAHIHN